MGSRANFVVVDGAGWTLRHAGWGADTLDSSLVWGPAQAEAFLRAQVETEWWYDEVSCEGAALMDLPMRLLLLFGGSDLRYSAPLQRLTMAVLRRMWPGWTVRWAMEGLGDLVDHLELDRALVRDDDVDDWAPQLLSESTETVWSVREADGDVRLYPLPESVNQIRCGAGVLDAVRAVGGVDSLRLPLIGEGAPSHGVHVDVVARTLDLWTPKPVLDLAAAFRAKWPGWRFTHHATDWASQTARAGGALVYDAPSQVEVE